MQGTTTLTDVEQMVQGFIVVAFLSPENQQKVYELQMKIERRFPGLCWFPLPDQMHVTVLHIITSGENYRADNEALFVGMQPEVSRALTRSIPEPLRVSVSFASVEAFEAAIIIKGVDDGTLDSIRRSFVSQFILPDLTRRPPEIIHSTIARFRKEHDIREVTRFVSEHQVTFQQVITKLELTEELKIFMQKYKTLQTFPS
jgi:hypothetical protein